MAEKIEIQRLVEKITDFVNSYNIAEDDFISTMELEHRTLQQSFTRLCLKWLQHCASNDYRYDDRNKGAHDVSKELVKAFTDSHGNINPSEFLPFI